MSTSQRAEFVKQVQIRMSRESGHLWADVALPDGTSLGGHGYELPAEGYRTAKDSFELDDKTDLRDDGLVEAALQAGLTIPAQWQADGVCADEQIYDALVDACETALETEASNIAFFAQSSSDY